MSTKAEKVCKVWEQYENGRTYQQNIRLTERCNENVNFFEGRQWAEPTEKTKNLPRPVINIVKHIIRNKVANIFPPQLN